MEKLSSRYIVLLLLMIMTIPLLSYLKYDTFNKPKDGIKAISNIPHKFGEWKGTDYKIEERVYELLETKSIIHRNYKNINGSSVFLSIVYHADTKVNFHGPEQCLGAQGIALQKTNKLITFHYHDKLIRIELNQLVQDQYGSKSLVYYFFKAGDFIGPNYVKLRLNIALNKFRNSKKNGVLIRFSTPINENDPLESSKILKDFLKDIYPYVVKYL